MAIIAHSPGFWYADFRMSGFKERIRGIIESLRGAKILNFVSITILLGAIPLTVFLASQQQDPRQRASELPVGYLQDNQQTPSGPSDEDKKILTLTDQLVESQKEYSTKRSISAVQQQEAVSAMSSIAEKRKKEMLSLVESDPKAFLAHARLAKKRTIFPQAVQEDIEEEKTIEGKLTVFHVDDFKNNKSKFKYVVESGGKHYEMYFVQNPPSVRSGVRVKARGIHLDSHMVLESGKDESRQLAPRGYTLQVTSVGTSSIRVPDRAIGEQKTAVFLVNFDNNPQTPVTKEEVHALMFANEKSLNNFYKENSFNKISFSGDVFGWMTIPYIEEYVTDCKSYEFSKLIISTARSQGINVDSYNRWVYVFAPVGECSGGWGTLEGNPSESWLYGDNIKELRTYVHELGHNVGLAHANSYVCRDKIIDEPENCVNVEYGDIFDVMGNFWSMGADPHHFNAPHKAALGWIPDSQITKVQQDGRYTVSFVESESSFPQAIKIPKFDHDDYYYLGFRKLIGYDTFGYPTEATRGATLYIWNDEPFMGTQLLDFSPSYTTDNFFGIYDAALTDGGTFVDDKNRVNITQVSHDENSVTLDIGLRPFPTNSFIGQWQETTYFSGDSYVRGGGVWRDKLYAIVTTYTYGGDVGVGGPSVQGSGGGGYNVVSSVQYASIGTDGKLGSWIQQDTQATLPVIPTYNSSVVANGYIYILGGHDPDYNPVSSVYMAQINNDGSVGSWLELADNPLPQPLSDHVVTASQDYIFVTGGWDWANQNTVYSAKIKADGTLDSWQTLKPMPKALTMFNSIVMNDFLYILGGYDEDYNVETNTYVAKINPDGTLDSWTTPSSNIFPKKIAGNSITFTNGHLLSLGGYSGSANPQGVLAAKVNNDGTFGEWTLGSQLPSLASYTITATANNYIYILGAYGETYRRVSYVAPLQNFPISVPTPTSIPTPTPTPSPTPTPTPPPPPSRTGKIVFSRYSQVSRFSIQGGGGDLYDSEIYIANPDGAYAGALTKRPDSYDYSPTISRDGKFIAFVSSSHSNFSTKITVVSNTGELISNIESSSIEYMANPLFVPDGSIIFSGYEYGKYRIYQIQRDGSNRRVLIEDSLYIEANSVSYDGAKLLYTRFEDSAGTERGSLSLQGISPMGKPVVRAQGGGGGNAEIYMADINGANRRNITNTKNRFEYSPVFSPTGTFVIFNTWNGTSTDLFRLNLLSKIPLQLTNTPRLSEYRSSFSPDGSKILVEAYKDGATGERGYMGIYTINADGSNMRQITPSSTDDYLGGQSWSVDPRFPNPTPTPSLIRSSYTLSSEYSGKQGPLWYYYFRKNAQEYGPGVFEYGPQLLKDWYGEADWAGVPNRNGPYWSGRGYDWLMLSKNHSTGGDKEMAVVYWKAPAKGTATITVTDEKIDFEKGKAKGNGYKFGIGYTSTVGGWSSDLSKTATVGAGDKQKRTLTLTKQVKGSDAFFYYKDSLGAAFGDGAKYSITVTFSPQN